MFPAPIRRLCLLLLSAVALRAAQSAPPALLPIENFFDYGAIGQVSLSPDGNKIAMLAPNEGRFSIAMLDTTNGKVSVVARFKDENIGSYFWKGNDHILLNATIAGHEVPALIATDLEGRNVKRILEPRRSLDDFSIFFGRLVDRYPTSDSHILIVGFTSESDATKVRPTGSANPTPTIYRVNVATARRTQVEVLEQRMGETYVDSKDHVRLSTYRDGKETVYRVRSRNGQPWREIKRFPILENHWELKSSVMADDRTIYVLDRTSNSRGVLRALDLELGQLGPVLFEPAEGEIDYLIISPKRQRLLGLVYESDRNYVHWFDERWKSVHDTLQRQFPEHSVLITSFSEDEKRFIVRLGSDRDPGQYLLGDFRSGSVKLQFITAARPAIKPAEMSPTLPVKFEARDGLTIHGYFTKPGGRADKHTPLLILPHGGPFGIRDSWGYDPEVQFLANRGYAVFQVNYRGSGGYGVEFMEAGYREWGGKMQNDLSDAVAWAISQGLADPERVGIIGASYGGYAALAGVTMTPELYKVGINYVGVSDLRLITRWDLGHGIESKAWFENAVGKDPEMLRAKSPVELVANIRVPTLHAYGKNDPRVEFNNWEVLEKALKKNGKVYEALIEAKEGHGFGKEEARLKFYGAVERFLAKYMPSDVLAGNVKLGPTTVIEMPAKGTK